MAATEQGLLAHIVSKFAPRQWENVASEALLYLLAQPGGNRAVNDLLAPLDFRLSDEVWRGQVGSKDDSAIPDLVAEVGGKPLLIIETKFWASLTANQPLGYLRRQQDAFASDPQAHLLLFLAPRQRRHLLTAELEERVGASHFDRGSLAVIDAGLGRIALVDWLDLLAHLEAAFRSLSDETSLGNLAQLRGLCDRADQEAMLPLTAEDLDPRRAQRQMEFHRVVRRVVDILVSEHRFSTKGLRDSASADGWGKYVSAPSGRELGITVALQRWGHDWPTPWWVRVWDPPRLLDGWLAAAGDDPGVGFAERLGDNVHLGLRVPLGVEEPRIAAELAQTIARTCSALPPRPETTTDDLPPEIE